MKTVSCRTCGKPIIFIRSGDRNIPCDARQVTYWQHAGAKGEVVTPNGELIRCTFDSALSAATGIGYKTHSQTCRDWQEGR